jgi:adenylate cyclase
MPLPDLTPEYQQRMASIPESNLEHERRFLVTDTGMLDGATFQWIDQGYLWAAGGYAIRIRLVDQSSPDDTDSDTPGILTLKGPRRGPVRFEQEALVPAEIAQELLALSNFRIAKRRYAVISVGEAWAVDVFEGPNEGLVIAEFEGSAAAVAKMKTPYWCGDEITDDRRWDNENLARTPFTTWTEISSSTTEKRGR